ncbi:hypothetical protein B4U79_05474 [Dinothrombium tinctorium]|uniref:Chitin-binding type-2 domain-containing protein n=1 Tax=Dinothrombium tinctorium TaxID=1965070 RepID=A0A3S3SN26_9ACAR|nr:hypothetical protein B4U79_10080 [Dinothrombium tinctorium]RWS16452.1 hypothetical protein B4U79_03892 [Dinothrombium tinctorium]RWS17814.1 hypothetical protein B4U79_05474 [Dinothrombium tinctorium]
MITDFKPMVRTRSRAELSDIAAGTHYRSRGPKKQSNAESPSIDSLDYGTDIITIDDIPNQYRASSNKKESFIKSVGSILTVKANEQQENVVKGKVFDDVIYDYAGNEDTLYQNRNEGSEKRKNFFKKSAMMMMKSENEWKKANDNGKNSNNNNNGFKKKLNNDRIGLLHNSAPETERQTSSGFKPLISYNYATGREKERRPSSHVKSTQVNWTPEIATDESREQNDSRVGSSSDLLPHVNQSVTEKVFDSRKEAEKDAEMKDSKANLVNIIESKSIDGGESAKFIRFSDNNNNQFGEKKKTEIDSSSNGGSNNNERNKNNKSDKIDDTSESVLEAKILDEFRDELFKNVSAIKAFIHNFTAKNYKELISARNESNSENIEQSDHESSKNSSSGISNNNNNNNISNSWSFDISLIPSPTKATNELSLFSASSSTAATSPTVSAPVPLENEFCKDKSDGFFADLDLNCQVYHFCNGKTMQTFKCPKGTLFNQINQTCDWSHQVNCDHKLILNALYRNNKLKKQEEATVDPLAAAAASDGANDDRVEYEYFIGEEQSSRDKIDEKRNNVVLKS